MVIISFMEEELRYLITQSNPAYPCMIIQYLFYACILFQNKKLKVQLSKCVCIGVKYLEIPIKFMYIY